MLAQRTLFGPWNKCYECLVLLDSLTFQIKSRQLLTTATLPFSLSIHNRISLEVRKKAYVLIKINSYVRASSGL